MSSFIFQNGEECLYIDIPDLLTLDLLETNWRAYKYLLEKYIEFKNPDDIRFMAQQGMPDRITKKLNDVTHQGSWFSSHAQALSYLVGTPTDTSKSRGSAAAVEQNRNWYGKGVEIPDDEGTEILKMMVKLGAHLNIHNYYTETMYETINQLDKITGREKNDLFKEYMNSLI